MLVIFTIALSSAFVFFSAGKMKKYAAAFYAFGAAVTVSLIILNNLHISGIPYIFSQWIFPAFTKGVFAAVLWFMVALTGALPNGTAAMKRLMPVRGELSVFSAVITLSHAVTYGVIYIRRIVSGRTDTEFIMNFVICLVLMIIMIPLTVISFKKIRKKMHAGTWKKIQKCAYLFYALIYVHILVIYLQKRNITADNTVSMAVYSLMFFGYAYLRIRKYFTVRRKTEKKTVLNIAAGVPVILTVLFTLAVSGSPESVPSGIHNTEPVNISDNNSKEDGVQAGTEAVTGIVSQTESSPVTAVTQVSVTQPVSETSAVTSESTAETVSETENNPDDAGQEENHEEQNSPENSEPPEIHDEPVYIYRSGTYTASAYGYDGDITASVTIENDVITGISAYSSESDTWYFDSAFESVKNQILSSQSTSVDAVSGATFSSNAIMAAVQKALDSARN